MIRPPRIVLATHQSEALRDRLVAELSDLKCADEAADWVHKNLPAKNTLTSADAKLVEATFRERLAAIGEERSDAAPPAVIDSPGDESSPVQSQAFALEITAPQTTIVQRRRATAKTIRLRDKEHCRFVAAQPCVVCGRTPAEAHHIRFAQPRALGRKVSHEYTVPSATSIIANCTDMGMKPPGGRGLASTAARRARIVVAIEIDGRRHPASVDDGRRTVGRRHQGSDRHGRTS